MLLGGARDVVVSQFRRLAADPRLEMERVMDWLNLPLAVTFRKGVTPGLPFRRPASRVAALVH
jgi:hypothetical protein